MEAHDTPVDEPSENHAVIKFYIQPSWDHRQHQVAVWAPEDWNDMTQREKDEFLDEQAKQWIMQGEVIEWGAVEFDREEERNSGSWNSFVPEDDEIEVWF